MRWKKPSLWILTAAVLTWPLVWITSASTESGCHRTNNSPRSKQLCSAKT